MRIGELAARSGVAVRMLRHYEQKGLLAPRRAANGYRDYDERDVEQAVLVSSMVRSGLPTRLIVPLLRQKCDAPVLARGRPARRPDRVHEPEPAHDPGLPGAVHSGRGSARSRNTTVRSITKLIAVAVPCAITQATV